MVRKPIIVSKIKTLYRCYACSYLENGVLANRNDKKTNYCSEDKETVPYKNWLSYHSDLLRRHFQDKSMHNNGTVSFSLLQSLVFLPFRSVKTPFYGKKTNYCNKEKETVPLLYMFLP
jgi:hypothetical protein